MALREEEGPWAGREPHSLHREPHLMYIVRSHASGQGENQNQQPLGREKKLPPVALKAWYQE